MDFFMHDSLIFALRMLLDFRKAKKHSAIGLLRFPKVSQHLAYKNKRIMHGNPYGMPLVDHTCREQQVRAQEF